MTLPELAAQMHAFKRDHNMCGLLQKAFSALPEPVITYAESYKRLVRDEVEQIPVAQAANRIVATGIVPYPPGIPLLAPGEKTGPKTGPVLQYLLSLQDFDRRFPGFEHDTHGIESIKGEYRMICVKEKKR
jgi:arginine/lysine/ornithine decarboxylase